MAGGWEGTEGLEEGGYKRAWDQGEGVETGGGEVLKPDIPCLESLRPLDDGAQRSNNGTSVVPWYSFRQYTGNGCQ